MTDVNNEIQGPKLTDDQFFGELIDCSLPGLGAIPALVSVKDFSGCRELFAAYVRKTIDADRFFRIPNSLPKGNKVMHPEETVEEAAERIMKLQMRSCGTTYQFEGKVDWSYNPTYNQYKEWTWQFNRHPEWEILAHQYLLTGDERYAKTFVQLFDSWVKQAVAPEDDVNGGETICWRTIECGLRMSSWPFVLFSFYKSRHFSDDVLVDWYKSVWEHGHRLELNHRNGNWLIMEMSGLAKIGILYPVFKQSAEWLNYALQVLEKELERQVYPEPDSFQYELSTAYHNAVIEQYMGLVRVMEVYEIPLPKSFASRMEGMLELYIKLMRPDGRVPDINDGIDSFVKPVFERYKKIFPENPAFQWASVDQKSTAGMPAYTSVAMEYAGMMIMRDGWGEDNTWGFFDAGPFGTGHQHEDKLNLLIHTKGKTILTECGNYVYDDSEMRRYAIATRSHNTVRVNGMDQFRRGNYCWHDEDIEKKADFKYRMEEEFDYVTGIYDEGYGNCNADTAFKDKEINDTFEGNVYRGAKHQRTVLFIKKPKFGLEPYFVVIDRLYSADRNEYEFLWHVDAEEVSVRGMRVKADFLHILNNLTDVREDGVSVICAQQQPEWQGWKKGASRSQRDDLPLPTVRYTTHAGDTRVITVLYPGEACPIAEVIADHEVSSMKFTLVLKNGERVEMDEANFAEAINEKDRI